MTALTKREKERLVNRIMADIPHVEDGSKIRQRALEIASSRLPQKVKVVWDDPKLIGYVCMHGTYLNSYGQISAPMDDNWPWNERERRAYGDEGLAELEQLVHAYKKEKSEREDIKSRLEIEISPVRTHKQFRERFPDLVKYLPEVEEVKNLPATTDLMNVLKAAGLREDSEG
jgi:hypothetical protein